ncbi:G/U mismatch-specific uracil-DNA glycosylase [Geodermatophilus telluris]|uniref:G/U mismatch-specific uracil-DNA glycosylase n=1 Tax=Geodermatophilus telluris TaxID=1190417 RepID=A0A1G6VBD0_9ACTN|nr:G/U mismatch-specific DNA glycosylase [Geodermatophilus telluris]SDD50155.1 G/U mismatch-specific uracil-DNA glycosylase [Geodermatophilus telluris]
MTKPLPDVVAPGLGVLFCGINPSLLSAARGHHFARPGNRFWPALHLAGLTPRRLRPEEDRELPRYGLGVTNLVDRPTRTAAELTREELRAGVAALEELVAAHRPRVVAVLGGTAWRLAVDRRGAAWGRQEHRLGGAETWVLPNPSGLNAHHQLPDLARHYAALRPAAQRADPASASGASSASLPTSPTASPRSSPDPRATAAARSCGSSAASSAAT